MKRYEKFTRRSEDAIEKARQAAGDEEGALECFLRASEMQPWHRDLATKVGMQLRVMGRTEEALEWTKRQRDEGRTTAANEQNRRWLEKRAKK